MCACNGSIGPVTVCKDVVVKVRLAVTDGVRRRFVPLQLALEWPFPLECLFVKTV